MNPYEAQCGNKPDLSQLRMFGSGVLCKMPGKRTEKLELFFANSALHNYLIVGADTSNAFSEADLPKQEYYIDWTWHFTTGGQSI